MFSDYDFRSSVKKPDLFFHKTGKRWTVQFCKSIDNSHSDSNTYVFFADERGHKGLKLMNILLSLKKLYYLQWNICGNFFN